jgi:hypothetical protein
MSGLGLKLPRGRLSAFSAKYKMFSGSSCAMEANGYEPFRPLVRHRVDTASLLGPSTTAKYSQSEERGCFW